MANEVKMILCLILEGILSGFLVWRQVYYWNDRLRDYGMFVLPLIGVFIAGWLMLIALLIRIKLQYFVFGGVVLVVVLLLYNLTAGWGAF